MKNIDTMRSFEAAEPDVTVKSQGAKSYVAVCSCYEGMEPHYRSRKPLKPTKATDDQCDYCGYYVKWMLVNLDSKFSNVKNLARLRFDDN